MSKELFMAAHEELVEEYLDHYPEVTFAKAYEDTTDRAFERMQGNLADRIDLYRQLRKEGLL